MNYIFGIAKLRKLTALAYLSTLMMAVPIASIWLVTPQKILKWTVPIGFSIVVGTLLGVLTSGLYVGARRSNKLQKPLFKNAAFIVLAISLLVTIGHFVFAAVLWYAIVQDLTQ